MMYGADMMMGYWSAWHWDRFRHIGRAGPLSDRPHPPTDGVLAFWSVLAFFPIVNLIGHGCWRCRAGLDTTKRKKAFPNDEPLRRASMRFGHADLRSMIYSGPFFRALP
jgi:hypothetical protein